MLCYDDLAYLPPHDPDKRHYYCNASLGSREMYMLSAVRYLYKKGKDDSVKIQIKEEVLPTCEIILKSEKICMKTKKIASELMELFSRSEMVSFQYTEGFFKFSLNVNYF